MAADHIQYNYTCELTINRKPLLGLKADFRFGYGFHYRLFLYTKKGVFSFIHKSGHPEEVGFDVLFMVKVVFAVYEKMKDMVELNRSYPVGKYPDIFGTLQLPATIG